MAMPVNLPSFAGYPHEDPAFHVERFEEILISNLITRPEYYLIWFPNTLVEGAYAWYRSNATGSFQTWCQLQAAFLQQFRPVTWQQQALAALTNIRQGQGCHNGCFSIKSSVRTSFRPNIPKTPKPQNPIKL